MQKQQDIQNPQNDLQNDDQYDPNDDDQDYDHQPSTYNQQGQSYEEVMTEKKKEMQQLFNEMAEKNDVPDLQNPVINIEQAHVLIDEMTDLLQIECDMAKAFLDINHESYQENFGGQKHNPPFMDYPTFQRILITALEEQDNFERNQQDGQQQDDDEQNDNFINKQQNPVNKQNTQDQQIQGQNEPQDDMYQPKERHYEDDPDSNIYMRHNNMIMGNFLHSHNKELLDYFSDFSKEEAGEPLVKGQDIPLVMRVAFYLDNITFHQTKEDPEEFFNKENSYKIVISQLDKYLTTQQNIDATTIDVTQYKITFIQFLHFVEYFLQNEPDIFLRRSDNEEGINNLETTVEQGAQTSLEKEILDNISKYENMLQEAQTENERIVINNMLKALYDQLSKIQSVRQAILPDKQGNKLTKEERRKKNLNEIFLFYCKQQYTQAPKYSFDRLLYESHTMNMSNFLLFAKQFKVTNYCLKLTKKMLPQLFKRVSNNYKDLTFQEFQVLLEKIALLMFEEKEDLPSEFDKIEAFYKYIGVDDQNFYRKHMHLLNPPFNIQDKLGFRHLPKDKERKIELRRIPPKLQNELERRKQERSLLVQKFISMTPQGPTHKHFYSNSQPNILNNSMSSQNNKSPFQPYKYQYDKYATRNHQKQISKLNINNKVTWQQLEKISYADMKKLNQNSKFKPTDLFEEQDDNEDKVYLRQYDLEEERNKKQELSYIHRKEQEKYGNQKNNLRPSQKYMMKQDPNYSERGYQNSNVHRSHMEDPNPYYYSPQPNYGQNSQLYRSGSYKNSNIGQNYMNRAQQIDHYQRQKENQQMQQMMYQNDQQMQRGLYAVKR